MPAASAVPERARPRWQSPTGGLLLLALAAVAVHLLTNGTYGYFRDELYYIACSDHLAWGYVDHPPLSIAVLALTRALLGDSISAIRLPVALAAGACVFLTGLLARQMGGGRAAQWLAALGWLFTAATLAIFSFFSMNAFDMLFWVAGALLAARMLCTGDDRLWLAFGALMGLGLLNKISVAFFSTGLLAGLLLTPQRRLLWSRWLVAGGALAALLFLPHLLWQAAHGFPTLEFMHNAMLYKNMPMSPGTFIGAQLIDSNPLVAPLWIAGLGALLFSAALRPYRALGLAYLFVLALLMAQHGKPYYLFPAYPPLLAAGGVLVERLAARRWRWLPAAAALWLSIGGIAVAPLALPVLPPRALAGYLRFIGIGPPREERSPLGALPQIFADRFGWPHLVEVVAGVYASLPPPERSRAAILAGNYGEAGAIDFFGAGDGLPRAISPHNNYWLWGPGGTDGSLAIAVGIPREDLERYFRSVEKAAVVESPWAMPLETNLPVYVCRDLRLPLPDAWRQIKRFT